MCDSQAEGMPEKGRNDGALPPCENVRSESEENQAQFASFLLAASSGIKFELQPNEDANSKDESQERQPFATLSEAGRYSKVILGRVISPGGAVLRDVAVKIQRDRYTHEQNGGQSMDTNPKINRPIGKGKLRVFASSQERVSASYRFSICLRMPKIQSKSLSNLSLSSTVTSRKHIFIFTVQNVATI